MGTSTQKAPQHLNGRKFQIVSKGYRYGHNTATSDGTSAAVNSSFCSQSNATVCNLDWQFTYTDVRVAARVQNLLTRAGRAYTITIKVQAEKGNQYFAEFTR